MGQQRLGGRYEVTSRLGAGGMAVVYRAWDERLRRDVAVKVLNANSVGASGLHFFHREARATAALQHPNIVQVHDYSGPNESPAYLIMELVDGATLEAVIKKHRRLPDRVVAAVLSGVTSALAYAHEHGVIHRDIKPANVLIEQTGRVMLSDFGIAKAWRDPKQLGDTVASRATMLVGTPRYMAPEQVQGADVGPPADVFAVGSLTYCMLTGRSPFAGGKDKVEILKRIADARYPRLKTVQSDVAPALDHIVRETLRRAPEQRPTADSLTRALEAWLHQNDVPNAQRCIGTFIDPAHSSDAARVGWNAAAEVAGAQQATAAMEGIEPGPSDPIATRKAIDIPTRRAVDASTEFEKPNAALERHRARRRTLAMPLLIGFLLLAVAGGFAWYWLSRPGPTVVAPVSVP